MLTSLGELGDDTIVQLMSIYQLKGALWLNSTKKKQSEVQMGLVSTKIEPHDSNGERAYIDSKNIGVLVPKGFTNN